MTDPSFTIEFTTGRSAIEVFDTINDVGTWWQGEIDGSAGAVGDVFTYRHGDIHRSTQRVAESVPGRRVVWAVDDAYLNFTADPAEWVGTRMAFDIDDAGDGTRVRFTHEGLTPTVECYDACSSAWAYYVGDSLATVLA